MNERLKELAVKAQVEHCISHVRLEEFAQLIISECAGLVKDVYKQGGGNYGEVLISHFKVTKK